MICFTLQNSPCLRGLWRANEVLYENVNIKWRTYGPLVTCINNFHWYPFSQFCCVISRGIKFSTDFSYAKFKVVCLTAHTSVAKQVQSHPVLGSTYITGYVLNIRCEVHTVLASSRKFGSKTWKLKIVRHFGSQLGARWSTNSKNECRLVRCRSLLKKFAVSRTFHTAPLWSLLHRRKSRFVKMLKICLKLAKFRPLWGRGGCIESDADAFIKISISG